MHRARGFIAPSLALTCSNARSVRATRLAKRLAGSRCNWLLDAHALARQPLVADINFAGRILADQHRRQTRHHTVLLNELRDLIAISSWICAASALPSRIWADIEEVRMRSIGGEFGIRRRLTATLILSRTSMIV